MLSFKAKCSIGILYELGLAAAESRRVTSGELIKQLGFDRHSVSTVIPHLRRAKWIDTINSRHFLKTDLSKVTLYDLLKIVDEDFIMGPCLIEGWPGISRQKYGAAREWDNVITKEFKDRIKKIRLIELFPDSGFSIPVQPVKKPVSSKAVRTTEGTEFVPLS